jgi:hypothetical protein
MVCTEYPCTPAVTYTNRFPPTPYLPFPLPNHLLADIHRGSFGKFWWLSYTISYLIGLLVPLRSIPLNILSRTICQGDNQIEKN